MNKKKIVSSLLAFMMVSTGLIVNTTPEVKADDGLNLALNASVRYSSTYGGGHRGESIVDGDINTSWASGSEIMDVTLPKHTMIIDLDSMCKIDKIILRSRRDRDQTYNRLGWEVYVSETADFKNEIHLGTKSTAGNFMEDFEISLKTPVKARYVKIFSSKVDIVVAECEVYGSVIESGNVLNVFSDIKSSDALNLVTYLKILEGDSKTVFNPGKLIKRGEAALITLNLVNQKDYTSNMYFKDVVADNSYFPYVSTCYDMGIIAKAENFNPDEYITVSQFYSMITKALGYSKYIEAKGGYPFGVMDVVRKLSLDNNVEIATDTSLNRETAVQILYNALSASPFVVETVNDDATKIEFTNKESALSLFYNMQLLSGVVNQNNETNLTSDNTFSSDSVAINNKAYTDKSGSMWKYIGKNVCYLVNKDTPDYIDTGWENTEYSQTTKIPSENVISISKSKVEYYVDKKANVKDELKMETPVVLKNGVYYSNHGYDESSICLTGATLEFIDNDDDENIEAINIVLPKYIAVASSSYSEADRKVILTDIEGKITVLEGFENMKISLDGMEVKPKMLSNSKFVVLYSSENMKNVEMKAYSQLSQGTVNEIDNDSITIDKQKFTLSDYLSKNTDSMGEYGVTNKITYFADDIGQLIWVSPEKAFNSNADAYGIITNMYFEGEEDNRTLSVKIYNANGQFTTNKVKNNLIVDGVKTEIEEIYNVAKSYYLFKFVMYNKNDNDEIILMDTENYNSATEADSELKKIDDNLNGAIYAQGNIYDTKSMRFATSSDLIVFNIPYVNGNEPFLGDDYDSYYTISNRNTVFGTTLTLTADYKFYAIGDDKIAGFAVKKIDIPYTENSFTPTKGYTGPVILVESVNRALLPSGEVGYKVTGYDIDGNKQVVYTVTDNLTKVIEYSTIDDSNKNGWKLINDATVITDANLIDFSDIKTGDVLKVDVLANTIYAAERLVKADSIEGIYYPWGRNATTVYTESKLMSIECRGINKGFINFKTAEDPEGELMSVYKEFQKIYVVNKSTGDIKAYSSLEIPNYAYEGQKGMAYYRTSKPYSLVIYE